MHNNIITNDTQCQIQIKPINKLSLKNLCVKAVIQGHNYVDITYSQKQCKPHIKKLSKHNYVVLSSGEIKKYNNSKNNIKTQSNLRKTFKNLRQLIRTNFDNKSKNQLFITLTYAENMTDHKRLYSDFDAFLKRLKRRFKEHKFDYIAVAEPQERGAWHFHILLKTNQKTLYINNTELTTLWGNGFTDVQRLKSDDVGSYYVAYFTDILDETKNSKRRKKGERLKFYPKNFKFYRCSRGIKKPVEKIINYNYIANSNNFKQTYCKTIEISKIDQNNTQNDVINRIQYETFKRINVSRETNNKTQNKQLLNKTKKPSKIKTAYCYIVNKLIGGLCPPTPPHSPLGKGAASLHP